MSMAEPVSRMIRARARHKPEYLHAGITEPALEEWINWLILERFPRSAPNPLHRVSDIDAYESRQLGRVQQRNDTHSDPTEASAITSQRRQTWLAERVNVFWNELPREHRVVVLAERLDMTQEQVGDLIGLRQQLVGVMLRRAKETIGLRLSAALALCGNKGHDFGSV